MSTTTQHEREIAELAHEIDEHLRIVRQVLRRPMEAEIVRGHLTAPQQLVMEVIVRSNGLNLKNLSKQVSLSHSTVSGIVDRLQKRGLVQRKSDPEDRRFTVITPSRAVHEFLKEKLPLLAIHPLIGILHRANATEREDIARGLRTLRRLAGEDSDKSRVPGDADSQS